MKLLICLGNPGSKYSMTRHNAGFMFADMLANKLGTSFISENKFKAEIAKAEYKNIFNYYKKQEINYVDEKRFNNYYEK